jgi:hypothetical protein
MLETVTTIVLTVGSGLLLCYWFRYTCLLILTAKTTRDYAGEVARANQLTFLNVQSELKAGVADLGKLQASLDRDYAILSSMLPGSSDTNIEDRMLQLNYKLTRTFCSAVGGISPNMARRSLDEMSMVVAHFANSMGERCEMGSAA